jgi:hypothetical protein
LEEENGRLKRLVADQAVQIQILNDPTMKICSIFFGAVHVSLKGNPVAGNSHVQAADRLAKQSVQVIPGWIRLQSLDNIKFAIRCCCFERTGPGCLVVIFVQRYFRARVRPQPR